MSKSKSTAGNTVASQAMFDREIEQVGAKVWRAEFVLDSLDDAGTIVKRLTLKRGAGQGGGWLAVVTADVEGEPMVAFHDGGTVRETLVGLLNRLENRGLKWREDQWAT